MKRLLLVLTAVLLASDLLFSHPASRIEIDHTDRILTVTVRHSVRDPEAHFIDRIDVQVDGKQTVMQSYIGQYTENIQLAKYLIPHVKEGSVIRVKTECSRGGVLEKEIKVQSELPPPAKKEIK